MGELVTLFIVTSTFVGLVTQLSHQLPDLQAGLGAVIRLRQMLAVEPEPKGGAPVPAGAQLAVEVRGLDFSYAEGSFALRDPELQELPQHEHAASLEKATGYITRLADEARLDFAQDERVLAELVLDTLNGVAWSWLAHRDNDLARQSLERFASLAASFARTSSEHTS